MSLDGGQSMRAASKRRCMLSRGAAALMLDGARSSAAARGPIGARGLMFSFSRQTGIDGPAFLAV